MRNRIAILCRCQSSPNRVSHGKQMHSQNSKRRDMIASLYFDGWCGKLETKILAMTLWQPILMLGLRRKCWETNSFDTRKLYVSFIKPICFFSLSGSFAEALWSADCWLNLLAKSSMFLSDLEESNRLTLGRLMINTYACLATHAVENKQFLFRLRPKFHLLHHLTIDTRPSNLNSNIHATWIDEDGVKKWMRIKRQVHKRTATISVIQRFVLGLRTTLERGMELARSSQ